MTRFMDVRRAQGRLSRRNSWAMQDKTMLITEAEIAFSYLLKSAFDSHSTRFVSPVTPIETEPGSFIIGADYPILLFQSLLRNCRKAYIADKDLMFPAKLDSIHSTR